MDITYSPRYTLEALRWRPAGRAGVPHQSTADDIIEYGGKEYFIPAGTVVFAPPWRVYNSERCTDWCTEALLSDLHLGQLSTTHCSTPTLNASTLSVF